MSSVRLVNLSKTFKETIAVDDISIEVQENEFFSLLGPSGCGKTTTLRMIGGFEAPTGGRVFLQDKEVTGLPPYKRDVNTVFQSYALFPHLNVAENVAFGLKRKKVSGADISRRVAEMLELVDLARFGERRTGQLSGGQQQRVALARALVNRPAVLLLDEPLGALDLKLRKQMQIELKRIQSEVGITFVYVTHDQEEAMTMSDRLAVMDAGHFEQIGAPQDVYDLPSTEFVAGFLGASNLLQGSIESADGPTGKVVLEDGQSISLPAERLPASSGAVGVGVRPEKLTIENPTTPGSGTGDNAIDVVVSVATYTGVATSYECATPDGHKVVVYAQNVGGASYNPRAGERVRLTWDPDHTFAVSVTDTQRGGGGT